MSESEHPPPAPAETEAPAGEPGPNEAPTVANRDGDRPEGSLEVHHLPDLPHTTRIILLVAGSGFLALGLVGLALPVVPQTAFLLVAAALFSVASRRVHDSIERVVDRWPRLYDAFARLRHRIHRWVAPRERKPGRED